MMINDIMALMSSRYGMDLSGKTGILTGLFFAVEHPMEAEYIKDMLSDGPTGVDLFEEFSDDFAKELSKMVVDENINYGR